MFHKKSIFWVFFILLFLLSFILLTKANSESLRNSRWGTWIDEDNDGQDTRQELLILRSSDPIKLNKNGYVMSGLWRCPYIGFLSTNPRNFDVDHVVPLNEAWNSGANKWPKQKRIKFANDFENLLLVNSSANRQKGDKDPPNWMPLMNSYHRRYLERWHYIKEKYDLDMDEIEKNYLIQKKIIDK